MESFDSWFSGAGTGMGSGNKKGIAGTSTSYLDLDHGLFHGLYPSHDPAHDPSHGHGPCCINRKPKLSNTAGSRVWNNQCMI